MHQEITVPSIYIQVLIIMRKGKYNKMIWFPSTDIVLQDGTPIPGSIQLVDTDNHITGLHESQHKEIVLDPQPTNHPDDPLNWSMKRKLITLFWPTYYTFLVAIMVAVPAVYYPQQAKDLNLPLSTLTSGTGYTFLFFAIGCFIFQPLALNYGRRPVYIYTLLTGGVACCTWVCFCKTQGSFYANRMILGLLLAPVESLQQVVCNDLFFTHERGLGISYYVYALMGGSLLGPFIGSFVNGKVGWKWMNYIMAILSGVGAIGTFLFMEETMFYRPKVESTSVIEGLPISEEQFLPDKEAKDVKGSDLKEINNVTGSQLLENESNKVLTAPQRKPYFHRYPVLYYRSPEQSNRTLFNFIRPFQIFVLFFPVVWSGLIVASALAWWSVAGATIATLLESPPYNFGATGIGLVYIGPTISSLLPTWLAGPLLDKWCIWYAKKNNGYREPEARLYLGIVPLILTPLGLWIYGFGAAHQWHYMALIMGYALSAVGTSLGTSIPYSYAIDCYPELAGDCVVTIIALRNLIGGFGFSYAITPWVERDGYQTTFIILGFLAIAFWLSSIPMIIFGKKLRRSSAHVYARFVAKN